MSGVYYPSLVVNMRILLDPAMSGTAESPSETGTAQAGTVKVVSKAPRTAMPSAVSGGDSDPMSCALGIVPTSAAITLAGHRQAGTFDLSLNYRDFPFDPRAVRAAMCEVHLGTVSEADFAAGVTAQGGVMQAGQGAPPRRSLLQTRIAGQVREDTLLMVGTVDEFGVEHADTGSTVSLRGRDLRGIFLDSPVTPVLLASVDASKPIDECVAALLSGHPFAKMRPNAVEVLAKGWTTVPALASTASRPRARRGASGTKVKMAAAAPGKDTSFWDIITHWCYQVGAIPRFVGTRLVIEPARALYERLAPDAETPFKDGAPRTVALEGGDVQFLKVLRIVYGRNVSKLSFSRKCGGVVRPVVECVSVDTSSAQRGAAKLLKVRWPSSTGAERSATAVQAAQSSRAAPSGQGEKTDLLVVRVPGVRDKARLLEIARQTYEEIGRQEIGGTFEADDCASYGGDNADPDLLRLRPGSAVEVAVDQRTLSSRAPQVAELIEQARRSEGEAVQWMVSRGMDRKVATTLVRQTRCLEAQARFFRVASVKFGWSIENGVSVSADFQNYIEVRADAEKAGTGAQTMRLARSAA